MATPMSRSGLEAQGAAGEREGEAGVPSGSRDESSFGA